MAKVGIITLNGYFNYGNRLQNYALQEVIKMNGYECETIINKTFINKNVMDTNVSENKAESKLQTFLGQSYKQKYKIIANKIKSKKINSMNLKRTELFKEFSYKYINETSFSIEIGNVDKDLEKDYEYLVVGSDQVWNPYDPMVSEVSFLTFAPEHKRISYAPSFGVYNIPDKEKENYTEWLNSMKCISVREDAGAKIVKDLTGREVPVVIDPTMMLTGQQWLSVARESGSKPKDKYILTYLLGGGSKEQKKKVKEISKKYNLKVVNLGDLNDEKHYVSGPSEFIDYINDASIFLTDSFHGCVFSMLMNTPFIVCSREGQNSETSMESRIDTFLEKFKLQHRRYSNIDNVDLFVCDYKESNQLLELEREKASDYLSSAFGKKCEEVK